MTDREKVIKGMEHCDFGVSSTCYEEDCPYYQSHDCTDELKNDILVLLKEQEAVKPIHRCWNGRITQLNKINGYVFCPYCGKEVKWNEVQQISDC